jgi:hypothetical protein
MNRRSLALVAALCLVLPISAQAKDRKLVPWMGDQFCGDRYCRPPIAEPKAKLPVKLQREHAKPRKRQLRHAGHPRALRPGGLRAVPAVRHDVRPEPLDPIATASIFARYALAHAGNAPTDRLPAPLQAKLGEIQAACPGFAVISTRCGAGGHSWNVAGTRKTSLHCVDKAADFRVSSYACADAHLRDWRGGRSLDPGRVGHIHLSWAPGSGEFGRAFYHGGGRSYARRHHSARHAGRHRHRHRHYARV